MKKRKFDNAENGFAAWGGYMDAKITKLEEQFAENALKNPYKESDLFAGISIFVNGLTNPSADELKRIMMRNGGVYHTYQRSSTKFIIASNLPDVKIRQITTAKIISPQWIVDCLKENRILDYSKYLLYTNSKVSQPKINFDKVEDNAEATTANKQNAEASELRTVDISISDGKEATLKPINELLQLPPLHLNDSITQNLDLLNNIIKVDISEIQSTTNKSHANNPPVDDVRRLGARSAVDPNFLAEFYNNSRLHHISTLGAGFKNHITRLRESHTGLFPAREKLRSEISSNPMPRNIYDSKSRIIMHIDMDCFFVSVGLRTRTHLKGHPVAVTHSKGGNQARPKAGSDRKKEWELYTKRKIKKIHNGTTEQVAEPELEPELEPLTDGTSSLAEIASCSYEARKMGIHNGMAVGAALKLCPNLKTMPYDFDAYKEVAYTLYNTIAQYTLDIEAVSCDEMYVDLTEVLKETNLSAIDFVSYIRNEITEKTQCPCSAGFGANKLQARMATKKAKPNGQFYLSPEDVEAYFSDISISELPGVGYSTTQKLNQLKLHTCSELQTIPLVRLQKEFGKKLGESLYEHCRGIDNKPLTYDQVRKSVSVDVNYGIRFTEEHQVDTFLKQLCAEIHTRLTEIRAKGKTITLKILVRAPEAPVETAKFMGCGYCDQVTKSTTLQTHTDDLSVITKTILSIKSSLNLPPHELRGIGIGITKLNTATADLPKSNVLKKMFSRVKEKNELRETVRRNSCDTFEELNLSKLNELPRKEVLNKQTLLLQKKSKSANDLKTNKLNMKISVRATSVENIQQVKEERMHVGSVFKISDANILIKPNWREILMIWLENTEKPNDYDSGVIIDFFKELILGRRLEQLYLPLKFLQRKISAKTDCDWHQVFYKLINLIQHHMSILYGKNYRLFVKNDVNCKKCFNLNLAILAKGLK